MTAMSTTPDQAKPWYREPWPWLLMAGPFIVIIAGLTTAWLALSTSDGLVSENYYKQGLAAGETLARSQRAEELGITAGLRLSGNTVNIRLNAKREGLLFPEGLNMVLSHPTRAGIDQKVMLKRNGEVYAGELQLPASGHWLVLIEDDARSWRLMGTVVLPAANEVIIGGGESAEKAQS